MDNVIKQSITDNILDAFHKAQNDILSASNGTRIKTWHVSDFTSPCLRKSYYQRIMIPEKKDPKKTSTLFMGVLLHNFTKLSHFHEVTFCYDIEKELSMTPLDITKLPKDETTNIITGTLDDLIKIKDDFVIVDKKTWNARGYKKTSPDEGYKLQLNIYRVLLRESYGIDAKYGCLLYLDKGNDLEETPLVFELDPIGVTKKLMREKLHLLQSEMPPATINFLCTGFNKLKKIYCPYVEQCCKDGNRN